MRTTFRALLGFFVLLIVTVGIGFGGYTLVQGRLDNNQASGGRGGGFFGSQEPTYTVDLMAFERRDYTPMITGFGSISAGRTADLRPLVSGLLADTSERLVEGALIREGTPLFTVDPFAYDIAVKDASIALRDAEARLATARADLAVEEAALALALDQLALSEAELARQTELQAQGIVSAAALGNAENATLATRASADARAAQVARTAAAVPTAELAVERAALTLERASRDLANTVLKAPFNGVAENVSFALGRQVSTNDVLARLVDLSQLELRFQLSDEQLGNLIGARGNRQVLRDLPVTLNWDVGAQQLTYAATIDRTAVAISENQGGIDVFARLTDVNPGNIPPVGAFMAYSFPEPTVKNVFAVPAAAVSPSGEMLAVADDKRIRTFTVDIERRVGDLTIVSGDAVKEGESFVARRFIQLGEGTKVNPNRPEVPEAPEAEVAAMSGGLPSEGPVNLTDEQKTCMATLIADLPDRPKERLQGAIESGVIENPERLKGMQERFDLDIDSCFPAAEVAAVAGDPGGFPTEGPVQLTDTQITCLVDLVENSSLPATPKGFIIPAIESGTLADPGRMAGLKERAGLDLDSCFPPTPAMATVSATVETPAMEPGGFPTEGPVQLTEVQQTCLIELIENSSLPATPKGFIIPAIESGTLADPGRMAGLKERAGIDLDSCFPGTKA